MLKEMQGNVIQKNTVLLNFEQLGYHARAQVFIKVKSENKEQLRKHLMINENANNVFKINNGWDFLVETAHRNIKDLDRYLEKLTETYGIEEKQIHYLIDEVKREGFMTNNLP